MASKATAITNVRVFDGFQLSEMTTLVMENGLISGRKDADVVIDGKGGFLMPGLIDSHSHLTWKKNAKAYIRAGVTVTFSISSNEKVKTLPDSTRKPLRFSRVTRFRSSVSC